MTLSTLLSRCGWSAEHVARLTGYSPATIKVWRSGVNRHGNPTRAPGDVLAWLDRVADGIEREPPPRRK